MSALLLAILFATSPADASVTVQQTEPVRYGRCQASMAERTFGDRPGLRVVITRFYGVTENSENLGFWLAWNFERRIPEYAESQRRKPHLGKAGLKSGELQIVFIPCWVNSHAEARSFGDSLEAHIVIWGQAYAPQDMNTSAVSIERLMRGLLRPVDAIAASKLEVCIGCNNQFSGTPEKVIINGIKFTPPESPSFTTYITAVQMPGLETESRRKTLRSIGSVMELSFPSLALDRPLALFHLILGLNARQNGHYATAARIFSEVQKMRRFLGDNFVVESLFGTTYIVAGQTSRGLKMLRSALRHCPADADCAQLLSDIGWAYYHLGNLGRAAKNYDEALRAQSAAGDRLGEASTRNRLGMLHFEGNNKEEARRSFLDAQSLYHELGDASGEASALSNLGALFFRLRDTARAFEYYEGALKMFRAIGDMDGEAATMMNMGSAFSDLGKDSVALDFYRGALYLRRRSGDARGEASALNAIGLSFDHLADAAAALEYYRRALALQQEGLPIKLLATIHNNIGARLNANSEGHKALASLDEARRLYKKVSDRDGEATAITNIATVYLKRSQLSNALSRFKQAVAIFRDLEDAVGAASALNNMGQLYVAREDGDRALESLQEALDLSRRAQYPIGEATALNNLGLLYGKLDDIARAEKHFEDAIHTYHEAKDPRGEAVAYSNLGDLNRAQEEWLKAVELYRRSSALYMSMNPPQRGSASESLSAAFGCARMGDLYDEGESVIKDIQDLGAPESSVVMHEALLHGARGGEAARRAYVRMSDVAEGLQDAEERQLLLLWARTGLERADNADVFKSCRGRLVTKNHGKSPSGHSILQRGDVLLKINGVCVSSGENLNLQMGTRVVFEMWRSGSLQSSAADVTVKIFRGIESRPF